MRQTEFTVRQLQHACEMERLYSLLRSLSFLRRRFLPGETKDRTNIIARHSSGHWHFRIGSQWIRATRQVSLGDI
jgi:hypothetical protein